MLLFILMMTLHHRVSDPCCYCILERKCVLPDCTYSENDVLVRIMEGFTLRRDGMLYLIDFYGKFETRDLQSITLFF